jgi:hypothetical protein
MKDSEIVWGKKNNSKEIMVNDEFLLFCENFGKNLGKCVFFNVNI